MVLQKLRERCQISWLTNKKSLSIIFRLVTKTGLQPRLRQDTVQMRYAIVGVMLFISVTIGACARQSSLATKRESEAARFPELSVKQALQTRQGFRQIRNCGLQSDRSLPLMVPDLSCRSVLRIQSRMIFTLRTTMPTRFCVGLLTPQALWLFQSTLKKVN